MSLNTQVRSIELQEIRPRHSSEPLWLPGQPATSGNLPLVLRAQPSPVTRWNSTPVRRVKHPRLQFDKGLQIDLLA